jgi:O-antigen/teichoic acid export membrane protein
MIAIAIALVGMAAWWRGGAATPIIIAVGLQKAVESASDLFFGLFQREERLKWMGQSVVLRSTIASIAFVGIMLTYGDLLAACLAGLLVRVLVFFLLDFTRGKLLADVRVRGSDGNRISALFKMSLPLAGGLFLMSFTVNIPRYFVEERLGVAALGVFAALIYAFQAGAMLVDAMSQAACVRLARYHLQGDRRAFRGLVLRLTALAAAAAGSGVFVAAVGGGPLLRIAYSAPFAQASEPFVWLSVCAVPWYCASVFGYALVARRQMSALFYCQMASLGATLAGSYWLIGTARGPHGLTAACSVVFLTYSVMLVLYGAVLWRGGSDLRGAA